MINSKNKSPVRNHMMLVHLSLFKTVGLVAAYLQRALAGNPWPHQRFTPRRLELSFTDVLEASPQEVFPLLCPVREYEWIEDWQCELVHSKSGFAEKGCVFTTQLALGETWVCSRYEPPRLLEFVINAGSHLAVTFGATLAPTARGTEICWTRTLTSLDSVGDRVVRRYSEGAYQKEMELLARRLKHYLATGQCLQTGEALVNRTL